MVSVLVAFFPVIVSLVMVLVPPPPVSVGSVHPDSVCVAAPPLRLEHVPVTGFAFLAAAMPPGSTTANDVTPTRAAQTTNRPG